MKNSISHIHRMGTYLPHAFATVIAFSIKSHFSRALAPDLLWILKPTALLSGILSGLAFQYDPMAGFVNAAHSILIAPACSGVNFLVTCFAMCYFSFAKGFTSVRDRMNWLVLSLAASYILTITVNSIRITVSVYTISHDLHWGLFTPSRIHRIEGVLIYFFFLVMFYMGLIALIRFRKQSDQNRPLLSLLPVFWYLLISLAVPVMTGNFMENRALFTEHGMIVFGTSVIVFGLIKSIRHIVLRIRNGYGIRRQRMKVIFPANR